MNSLLIRVEKKEKKGAGYVVSLHVDPNGGTDFSAPAVASDSLPQGLALNPQIEHPVDRVPLIALKARSYLQPKTTNPLLVERTGAMLFQLLARPKIEAVWSKFRAQAHAQAQAAAGSDVQLRTFLEIRPAELRAQPWEAMRTQAEFLARSAQLPLLRWTGGLPPRLDSIELPLRVLLIIGCDLKAVDGREEFAEIVSALCPKRHQVDLDYFDCRREHPGGVVPALEAFIGEFAPDIIHFIGHGKGATKQDGAGLLLCNPRKDASDAEQIRTWRAADIAQVIRNTRPVPRLAVLNACRTAEFAELGGTWSLADALLAAGVDAVVGMQDDVHGAAAARFAADFYKALGAGTPLDAAVAVARNAMAAQSPSDWTFPTLVAQRDPGTILQMQAPVAPKMQLSQDLSAINQRFIDRRVERRTVVTASRRVVARQPLQNVNVIKGGHDIGKSWLLKYALSAALARGFQAVYVDLTAYSEQLPKPRDLSAIDFMRAVRGERNVAPSPLRPELYSHFARFNDTISALLAGNLPADSGGNGEDTNVDWRPGPGGGAHPQTMAIASDVFLDTLQKIAGGSRLVIGVDHLNSEAGGLRPDQFQQLLPYVIEPIAAGMKYPGVALLIAAPVETKHLQDFGLLALDQRGVSYELQAFPAHEWEILMHEFAAHRGWRSGQHLWRTIDNLSDMAEPSWDPETLDIVERYWRRTGGRSQGGTSHG